MSTKLESEEVIIAAPFSFVGSAQRIWRIVKTTDNQKVKWLIAIPLALSLIAGAWSFVACWYALFGVLVIPFRLLRRSDRKQHKQRLQHRELMAAVQAAR